MLIELSVRNLAIFEDVRVEFSPGLNMVTGETGTGKSILVEAIRLALGEKADPLAVRTGEAEAEVSAFFDLSGRLELKDAWEEAGLPWEEEVVLRRILPAGGRSRAYLNERVVAQSVLAVLSPLLLTMVGQHSVTQLLSRTAALSAIDDFAGTAAQASDMRKRYRKVSVLRRQVEDASARGAAARGRAETLDFEIGELSGARLVPGEGEELATFLHASRNEIKIREALLAADDALSSSDSAAVASLGFALSRLKEAAAMDPGMRDVAERLGALREETVDVAREIGRMVGKAAEDPEKRERAEERLSLLRRLERKYGKDASGLIAHLADLEKERESLEGALEEETRLRTELRREEEGALVFAKELSAARTEASVKMGPAVMKELEMVSMSGARFIASVTSREPAAESLSESGLDAAEFFFSANKGQEPHPLASTASGGELSRVMLSLRNAASRGGGGRTLVFDEIDTGIGGNVAERVGARLKMLAAASQVICVTHLPQAAAFADRHILVLKRTTGDTTATLVKSLEKQDRINELARMISGSEVTAQAKAHAKTMIEKAGGK